MTPKEKAKELVEKYADNLPSVFYNVVESKNYHMAKKCALIAVDEMIRFEKSIAEQIKNDIRLFEHITFKEQSLFYNNVKQEIEKL